MAVFPDIPSKTAMKILADLAQRKESHAPAIVARNDKELSLNTIYVHLARLHARRLVTSRFQTDPEHKARTRKLRLFRLTPYGRQMYEAALQLEVAAAHATAGIVRPRGAY